MAEKLDDPKTALAPLLTTGWSHDEAKGTISKTFKFKDFKQAFAWMTAMADAAEELNHHPEWFNVYNRVEVTLTTHDAGGLTDLDITLARRMDAAA